MRNLINCCTGLASIEFLSCHFQSIPQQTITDPPRQRPSRAGANRCTTNSSSNASAQLQFLEFPSVATNCARQKEKRARSANQSACQDGIYFLVRRFNRVSSCTATGSEPMLKTDWQ